MSSKEELIKAMSDGVVAFEEEQVAEAAQKYVDAGYDPLEGVLAGLSGGMMRVGELFAGGEYFVPEVLLCADAMDAGLKIIRPHIPKKDSADSKPAVLLATVEGDVHDIGKNLVKLMLDVNGYTVHDLGADVPLAKIVEELTRTGAKIVGLSAMMTTTMMAMKKVISHAQGKKPGREGSWWAARR